ncbi:MAG: hypothetical protein K5918_05675 [Bacteroidales bacterium]|nr:hypothetical protein [Bacteroidales bacterium]
MSNHENACRRHATLMAKVWRVFDTLMLCHILITTLRLQPLASLAPYGKMWCYWDSASPRLLTILFTLEGKAPKERRTTG